MSSDPRQIHIEEFDYGLPDQRIARHPLQQRDQCKLLVRDPDGTLSDHIFTDLVDLLPERSLLVCNNTRVINARLRFRKGAGTGALIEVFCLEPEAPADYATSFASTDSCSWICFVGNSKRWKQGPLDLDVTLGTGASATLRAERTDRRDNASVVRFSIHNAPAGTTFGEIIEAAGEIPIPPYLNRSTEASDTTDYQTVFSHIDGSVAAPTAGLHFTPELLDTLHSVGIDRRELTLHVGAGTFQPVKSSTLADHSMHSEFIAVPRTLIEELAATDRYIVAVGTTSVRTLESLYHAGCMASKGMNIDEIPQWYPYEADHLELSRREALNALLGAFSGDTFIAQTRIIIAPGYRYRVVDAMVTNFHQPQSTLLLLVSAFTGGDWRRMYAHALDTGYRFLSYGDACLLLS